MKHPEMAADSTAPDVYFTKAYGQAEEACGSGEWLDLQAFDGRWRMPVHLRELDDLVDSLSPYGYAGIYVDPDLSQADQRLAWTQATSELRDREVLSVFIRQTPLVGAPFNPDGFRTVIDGHSTICLDTTDSDASWTRMEGRSRTSIRKAERLGLTVEVRETTSADLAANSSFRDLYEGAMRRREAEDRYFFPDAYYDTLSRGLGENLLITSVADESGTPVSAALLMRHGSLLHYHLSGALPDAGRNGATNLMLWGAIQWAAQRGVERFHLGGGVSNGDSLFKFKRSFGGEVLSYSCYGAVLDQGGYDQAVAKRAAKLDRPISELLSQGFFPQFRISS